VHVGSRLQSSQRHSSPLASSHSSANSRPRRRPCPVMMPEFVTSKRRSRRR